QEAGIIIEDAYIGEVPLLDFGDELRHAIHKGLAAQDAHMAMRVCLMGEMLATAKADFEPDFFCIAKEALRIERRITNGNGDPRQEGLHQICLARLQRLALDAPIDMTARGGFVSATHVRTHSREGANPSTISEWLPRSCLRDRSSPRRSRPVHPARGRNGHRPRCAHRSAC